MRLVRPRLLWWYLLFLTGIFSPAVQAREFAESAAIQDRLRRDVTFLASDACEGRGVSTRGINLAADYIAAEFKKAGLKPAGDDGTFFQNFKVISGAAKLESPNTLVLTGPKEQRIEL